MSAPIGLALAPDAATIAEQVATSMAALVAAVQDADAARVAHIALAGGSTPRAIYERLAALDVDWSRVHVWFGDERAVAADHADANWRMAREALLDRVPAHAHRMPADSGDADAYERAIREHVPAGTDGTPRFDLVLLGLGTDGHTASLFPGTPALAERERLVVMNDGPGGSRRMTFTFPLINAARQVWLVATGDAKQAIVTECFAARWGTDEAKSPPPVLGVAPVDGDFIWWLDEAAGGSLRRHRGRDG